MEKQLRTIDIYKSPTTIYLVGSLGNGKYNLITFDRTIVLENRKSGQGNGLDRIMFANTREYTRKEIAKELRIGQYKSANDRRKEKGKTAGEESNQSSISTAVVASSSSSSSTFSSDVPVHSFRSLGIIGIIRFLKGYYLLFVVEKKRVGYINGNVINQPTLVEMLSIHNDGSEEADFKKTTNNNKTNKNNPEASGFLSWFRRSNKNPDDDAEARYFSLFQLIDFTRDFFWSYSYDLTRSLQSNMMKEQSKVNENFLWNEYLRREFQQVLQNDG